MIVAYKECQDCIYYSPIDKFYCHCSARDKKYHYGQWVPCEDKKLLEVTLLDDVDETAKDEESAEKAEEPVENVAKNTEGTVSEPIKPKRTRKKTR